MNPFIGQIVMFGGNFSPRAWAFCSGQLISIAQNSALFSILGTTFGGDGRTTFGLPDLRGRGPIHPGTGPGLSTRILGQRGGSEYNILNQLHMPSHSHTASGKMMGLSISGDDDTISPGVSLASGTNSGSEIFSSASPNVDMANGSVEVSMGFTGGNLSVNNMEPWLAVNYIIALYGVYPSRS